MQTFIFDVEQVSVGANQHSWIAVERSSGAETQLPQGGNGKFIARYPEIESFLIRQHSIDVSLIFVPHIDELTINPDGTSTWIFHRQVADVVVNDIPRLVGEVTFMR